MASKIGKICIFPLKLMLKERQLAVFLYPLTSFFDINIGVLHMKSMKKFTAHTGLFTAFFLTIAAFASTAQAHEFRAFGRYIVGIGSTVEPPQVGAPNGIDLFAQYDQDPGPGVDLVALDKAAGDIVQVAVIPIAVKTESNSAPVVGANHGVFTDFGNLVEIEDGEFGYQIPVSSGWTPTSNDVGNNGKYSGYLGYYVTAYLKKVGKPATTLLLKKFVCGNGSLDTEFGSVFDCVVP